MSWENSPRLLYKDSCLSYERDEEISFAGLIIKKVGKKNKKSQKFAKKEENFPG